MCAEVGEVLGCCTLVKVQLPEYRNTFLQVKVLHLKCRSTTSKKVLASKYSQSTKEKNTHYANSSSLLKYFVRSIVNVLQVQLKSNLGVDYIFHTINQNVPSH